MQIEYNTERPYKRWYNMEILFYTRNESGGIGISKLVTGKWRFSTYCNKSTGPALGIG